MAHTQQHAMTAAEARAVFDSAIVNETDTDRIAKVELLREYFTNSDFRRWMHSEVAQLTQSA